MIKVIVTVIASIGGLIEVIKNHYCYINNDFQFEAEFENYLDFEVEFVVECPELSI